MANDERGAGLPGRVAGLRGAERARPGPARSETKRAAARRAWDGDAASPALAAGLAAPAAPAAGELWETRALVLGGGTVTDKAGRGPDTGPAALAGSVVLEASGGRAVCVGLRGACDGQ